MPTQSLPNNPSLENLRKQAKSLLKAVHADQPEALARVREFHPRFDRINTLSLNDAQLVIARSYAFASWSKLKQHVELIADYSCMPRDFSAADKSSTIANQFISLACLTYCADHTSRQDQARELFATYPLISRENIYAAATVGDVAAARQMLRENPALAKTRGGPHKWEPLLYAAYSRLNSNAEGHSTLEVARLLLEYGADPNAGFLWDGHYLFTALTGAFGEGESGPANQPEHQYCYQLARLLLEEGADPNDSQTLYNRMFTGGTHHLELLFEFGLGKSKPQHGIWFKRLGRLLQTPTQMLQEQMGWAAKYNQLARLKLLVEKGVDVNSQDGRSGRTPHELALLNGNKEIANYLLAHGARQSALSDLDAFAAACLSADTDRASSLLAKDATIVNRLGRERAELLNRAAESDRREAIKLMAELGFNLNEVKRTAPLHLAAAGGHLAMVKLLIELGADPEVRDTEYNATPLGWAEYHHQTDVAEVLKNASR